jgi:hypothetical protein
MISILWKNARSNTYQDYQCNQINDYNVGGTLKKQEKHTI